MHWTLKTMAAFTLAGPLALVGCDTQDQHHGDDGSATKEMHEEGSAAKEHGDEAGSEKKEDGSDSRY